MSLNKIRKKSRNVRVFIIAMIACLLLLGGFHYLLVRHVETVNYLVDIIFVIAYLMVVATFIFMQLFNQKNYLQMTAKEQQDLLQLNHEHSNQFEGLFFHTSISNAMTNLDGRFIKVNKAFCDLLGYLEEDVLAMNLYYLIQSKKINDFQIHIQKLIEKKIQAYDSEQRFLRKNGDDIWVRLSLTLVYDYDEKPKYFLVQAQNITLLKRAEDRLRHVAFHDALTGLANKNRLENYMNQLIATAKRRQLRFALLRLDLDNFKFINDTIGHEAGDLVLKVVAERMRNIVRSTDMVARYSEDEFLLLVTDINKTDLVGIIADKVLESIMLPIIVSGQQIYITSSIGISVYPHDGQTIQTLMTNADLALYRAKEAGKNTYQFYTAEMTKQARAKLHLKNAIGLAISKNEFTLHYQPTLDIKTREITSIEALLRWNNKDFGMITPNEIIAIAEETGLLLQVSDFVLRTATRQLKEWHELGFKSLTISVNFSKHQFNQPTLIEYLLNVLTESGLSPNALEIEITEGVIIESPDKSLRILHAIRDLGIKIVIDDFGTGYWSHANLRKFSVDKLKIDKSFTKEITQDATCAAITTTIIAMARKFGITCVAEGVETREQYSILQGEGCDEIQGYYITQPLNKDAMTNFLKHPIPDAESITLS